MARKLVALAVGLLAGLLLISGVASGQPAQPVQHRLDILYAAETVRDARSLSHSSGTQSIIIGTVADGGNAQLGEGSTGADVVFTDWKVRVDRPLRNATAGQVITVRSLGGSVPAASMAIFPGVRLNTGEQVVLFLTNGHFYVPRSSGVFSVVGEGFGVYRVQSGTAQHPVDPSRNKPLDQLIQEIDYALP